MAKKMAKKSAKKKTKKAAPKKAKKVVKKAAKNSPKKMAKKAVKKAPKKKTAPKASASISTKVMPAAATDSKIKVGDQAPGFNLLADNGSSVSLSQFSGKNVVLYFYPKDDTPGCTQEACDFRDNMTQLGHVNAVVLGISKDSVESHQKFKTKFGLSFTLLSDLEGKVCEAYGVWKEKSMYGRNYMGIERSTFIIGGDGKVKRVFPKVSVTGHVKEIVDFLKS